jgi:hypothetical protein
MRRPTVASSSAKAFLAGVVVLAAAALVYAQHLRTIRRASVAAAALSASVARGDLVLRVPRAPGPITLDGDTDDPGWRSGAGTPGPARTGAFLLESGDPAVPYSEARLVWGGEYLYLALFASDEDIESRVDRADAPVGPDDDSFHVVFTQGDVQYAIDVSPNATVTDARREGTGEWDVKWSSGAHAWRELGGTVNAPQNVDEEWEIEIAIPLASLGMLGESDENIGLSFRRCDTPKESSRVCAGWGEGVGGRGHGRIVLE